MDQIIAHLVQVDKNLDMLAVKGDAVFALANARINLKAAYDECCKLKSQQTEEVEENGG